MTIAHLFAEFFSLYLNPPSLPLSLICTERIRCLCAQQEHMHPPSDVLSWSRNCVPALSVCKRSSSSHTEHHHNGIQKAVCRQDTAISHHCSEQDELVNQLAQPDVLHRHLVSKEFSFLISFPAFTFSERTGKILLQFSFKVKK